MPTNQTNTSAPKLSPFPGLVLAIEIVVAIMVLGGFLVAILPIGLFRLIGGFSIIFGGFIFAFGFTSHSPSKPRQAGLLTFLDTPIRIAGENVVVGGKVVIVPFLMNSIKIDMDNQEHEIPFTIVSGGPNKVPMPGKIILTLRPDIKDLEDYNQAGNDMKKIAAQLEGPVIAETKNVVKTMAPIQISQEGNPINDALETLIKQNLFQRQKLGLELVMVRNDFPMPDEIQKEMRGVESEGYQRKAETVDSQTISNIARAMQREDAIQYLPAFDGRGLEDLTEGDLVAVDAAISRPGGLLEKGKVFPFQHYREAAERRRLIRDGKVTKIEGVTGSFSLNQIK